MFDDLDAALSGAIKGAFAEVAVLLPRVSTLYAERVANPAREGQTTYGVFSAGPADDQLRGNARGSEFSGTSRLATTSAEFWIAKAEVEALDALPARGDTITLTARSGSPVYAISAVQHTDMGDLNLILVREDQPPPPPPPPPPAPEEP
jgi:hypothetical protein